MRVTRRGLQHARGSRTRGPQLWVDDQLIVDQWSSLASTTPEGTLVLGAAAQPRDLRAAFARPAHAVVNASIPPARLLDADAEGGGMFALLGSSRLFRPLALSGSPFPVTLH